MTEPVADRRRLKDLDAQLAFTLQQQAVDAVIDVGANVGQFATRLRTAGWPGPILSLEPIPEIHRTLAERATTDPAWEVASATAIGPWPWSIAPS